MTVVHWSITNGSGMNNVASSMVESEKALSLNSIFVNPQRPESWGLAEDADVHVVHTHFPDQMRKRVTKPLKLVYVAHGTPEHIFETAVEEGSRKSYGHADGWMLTMNWMRTADAVVTFWPRHQAIWQSMADKATTIHCVPLGVDKNFWKPMPTKGKFAGTPSVLTCENQHRIKWALDLFVAWGPWIAPNVNGEPRLHHPYMPNDMHRWFFPLINRNSTSYWSHVSPIAFDHDTLRNAFCSVDFFIGLVQKGDFNRLSLEANACGAKTISYRGNPYSAFHVDEGDQRMLAEQLVGILNGEVEPRKDRAEVPSIESTANAMVKVYESIL